MTGRFGPRGVKAQNLGLGVPAPNAGECKGCKALRKPAPWHDELDRDGLCSDCRHDPVAKAKLGAVIFRFGHELTPAEQSSIKAARELMELEWLRRENERLRRAK